MVVVVGRGLHSRCNRKDRNMGVIPKILSWTELLVHDFPLLFYHSFPLPTLYPFYPTQLGSSRRTSSAGIWW